VCEKYKSERHEINLSKVLSRNKPGHNPKNKEGLLLRYRETCCSDVATYRNDAGVTAVAPHQAVTTASHSNPYTTVIPETNFAAAVLQDEPADLAPAPALGNEAEITPALGNEAEITPALGNEAETED
jgi:hypothetical protein